MKTKDHKNINIEININTWKKLKMSSIDKDMDLQDIVREILEKHTDTFNKDKKVDK